MMLLVYAAGLVFFFFFFFLVLCVMSSLSVMAVSDLQVRTALGSLRK